MASDKAQVENIVSRSGTSEREAIPRFTIKPVQADENGSLLKIEAQPRRYFYPKNGSMYAP